MERTLGLVHLRPQTPQALYKSARKLGGKSLLELVVRRLTDCQRLDQVVVVLGQEDHDERARLLVPPDVPTFSSQRGDPLSRMIDAIDHFQAQAVVRVLADAPFVDPVLVDRLVSTAEAHRACDYISYCSADGRPAIMTHLGLCAEWCAATALRRAYEEARGKIDRDAVTSYLYSHPERFNVRLIPLPAELDRHGWAADLDVEQNWDHAQAIYEALGGDEWDWRRLADPLATQTGDGG
jgi:spore coat polysaccharide biosynthesis protein SpsF